MYLFYRPEVKKLISSCLRISPIRNPISHSEFEKRISIMDKMLWNKVILKLEESIEKIVLLILLEKNHFQNNVATAVSG